MDEEWKEAFGPEAEPRSVQQEAIEWWNANGRRFSVLEAPTGCGKSLLGSFLIHQWRGRGIYVCPTKMLQMQIARDSAKWPQWVDADGQDTKIVCLYGKGNYWCDDKVHKHLVDLNVMEDDGRGDDAVTVERRILSSMQAFGADPSKVPRDIFDDTCRTNGVTSLDEQNTLWNKLSPCERTCECLTCTHKKQLEEAQTCKMLIINTALFFTHLKHTAMLDLSTDLIIIDEGHALAENCSQLIEGFRPKDFSTYEVVETARHYRKNRRPIACNTSALEHVEVRADSLVFDHDAFCSALAMWENTLDHEALKNVIRFLKITDNAMTTAYQTAEAHPVDEDKSFNTKLLDSYYETLEGKVDEQFRLQSKECFCVASLSKLLVEMKDMPLNVLTYAATTDDALRKVLDAVGTNGNILHDVKEIAYVYDQVAVAKMASNKTWLKGSYSDFAPTLCKTSRNIEYVPTIMYVAEQINKYLWTRVRTRVLIMSATLANMAKPTEPFRLYLQEVGLDHVGHVATQRMDQAFDRTKVRILSPLMDPYKSQGTPSEKNAFRRAQVDRILEVLNTDVLKASFQSVLVLGPSANEEAEELYSRIPAECDTYRHLNATRDKYALDMFHNDPNAERCVVYGGRTLAVGLNEPGRYIVSVITRAPNDRWRPTRMKYHQAQGYGVLWDDMYTFKRDQLALQAAGRVQRSPDDRGFVLVLGEPDKLKKKLLVSETICRAWEVPESSRIRWNKEPLQI